MAHYTTPEYWFCYHQLPRHVQQVADKNYALLQENPYHPSLHFKRIQDDLWSVRAGRNYRALATRDEEGDFIWFWIGSHSTYDHLTG